MQVSSSNAHIFAPENLAEYEGFELIPLHRPGDKDKRGRDVGKAPLKTAWRRAASLSVNEADELMTLHGHNIGVRLRATDLVIDVDPRHFEEGDDPLERLRADLDLDLLSAPTVVTGSGGLHIYLQKPSDTPCRDTLEAYPGIEFKSIGRQVVAAGSAHPITGRPYELDPLSPPLSARPVAPRALLEVIKRPGRLAGPSAGKLQHNLEAFETGLNLLDARDFGKGRHESWFQLMCACHHATAGDGRSEFLAWCMTDPEYSRQGEAHSVGRRWDSLHSDSPKNITWRYLFKCIAASGDEGKQWILSVDRTAAADDFPTYDEDGDRDIVDIVEALPDGNASTSEALEWFNRAGFCSVMDAGRHRIMQYRENLEILTPEGAPVKHWYSMAPIDFLGFNSSIRCQSSDGSKTVELAREWLKWGGHTRYDDVVFDPAGRHRDRRRVLNLWTDFAVQPKKGDWSLLRVLIEEAFCDGKQEWFDYIMRWSAFAVQKPDVLPEVALVFRGRKGSGKGTFARALMNLFGKHSLHISNSEHFTGRFNSHLRDKCILFLDEAFWAGNKKAEGDLKRNITEPTLAIEGKNKDVVTCRNMLHVLMASNEDWVIPASAEDERRFAVFDVNNKFRGNTVFFDKLYRQMNDGGLAALLWDLKTLDLGDWKPNRQVPITWGLVDQKLHSLSLIDKWWYECLLRGHFGVKPLAGKWGDDPNSSGTFVVSDLCMSAEAYARSCGDRSPGRRSSAACLNEHVASRCGPDWPYRRSGRVTLPRELRDEYRDQASPGSNHIKVFKLPSLSELRRVFAHALGGELPWPEPDEEWSE